MSTAQWSNEGRKGISQSNNEALRNPWILGIIAIMVTFLTVNAIFITLAFISSPGLVVNDYYEQGRAYEKNALKMLAATQGTRDWVTRLDMENRILVGQKTKIRFTAVDARGVAIHGANIQLVAYRPSDATRDDTQTMHELAAGTYETMMEFPLKGIWDVRVKVELADNRYELVKRLSVLSE